MGSSLIGKFFTRGHLIGHWPALRAGTWAIQLHYGGITQCSEEPWWGQDGLSGVTDQSNLVVQNCGQCVLVKLRRSLAYFCHGLFM